MRRLPFKRLSKVQIFCGITTLQIWPYLGTRKCLGHSVLQTYRLLCFLSELYPFMELCPFEKIRMKSCQQDISKSIGARGVKLGQLIGDDE